MANTRGLLGDPNHTPPQTMVAVSLVLEATKDRVGSQKLQRAEHRRLTKAVLEGSTPEEIQAALGEWSRKMGGKAPPLKDTALLVYQMRAPCGSPAQRRRRWRRRDTGDVTAEQLPLRAERSHAFL